MLTLVQNLINVIVSGVGQSVPYRFVSQAKVHTSFGDISTDLASIISFIGVIGVSVGGIAAIGLLIVGGFSILTSAGEPEKLMNGREMITNALMGLALIVLAVFVLEFLGWDVLGIEKIRDILN